MIKTYKKNNLDSLEESMNELIKQLKAMGLTHSDKVLVHSSLKAINRDANLVIESLIDYFNEGMVLLPTHSWSTMTQENNVFNPKTEPSCVGLLTNLFRVRQGVKRSLHPTHSIAGFGKDVDKFLDLDLNDINTPCHPNGTWGNLGTIGTKILLIGTDMKRNTFVHAIEEMANIEDRFTKEMIEFELVTDDGIMRKKYYKHEHPVYQGLSNNYKIAEQPLIDLGIITKHKFGDAEVLMMDAMALQNQILTWLKINPKLFDTHLPMDEELAKIKYQD